MHMKARLGILVVLFMGAGMTFPDMAAAQPGETIEGTWLGTLMLPSAELRIVFHVTPAEDGSLTATLDSPDQGATGIPVDAVTVAGDSVLFSVKAIGGLYEGILGEGGETLEGQWKQGGATLPLALERVEAVPEVVRPQEPERPYPYDDEEVFFDNPDAEGVRLAGTLTLPRSEGPHPAVILISGSGSQDRDESLMGHRPFLVLADHLTRQGIAVLRFDDRGTAASTGDFSTATTEDFASDVEAGVAFLRTRADIDPGRTGLVGHSEGGLVAPMVAVANPEAVAFLVLMAGPGLTGEEILYLQSGLIARASGASKEVIAQRRAQQEQLFAVLKEESDRKVAEERLRALVQASIDGMTEEERAALTSSELDEAAVIDQQIRPYLSPWFRYFLMYNPIPTLTEVQVPVLAINGEKDLQVPPKENLAAIEAALKRGGNEDVTTVELSGLNHLFQTAQTGSPAEYAQIEETMAPVALNTISDWILEQVGEE